MSDNKEDLVQLVSEIETSLSNASKSHPINSLEYQKVQNIESDRELKKLYAYWFIGILISQLLIMNSIFIGVGMGWFVFTDHVLKLYMGGTLLEVFGVVVVITKNLFPKINKT